MNPPASPVLISPSLVDDGGGAPWWRLTDAQVNAAKAHPQFAQTQRAATEGALAVYDAEPIMQGALRDVGRYVAGLMALHLHATGGLTLARLRAVCTEVGITGRGRAMAILMMLRMIGYVRQVERPGDARVKVYVPTPSMQAAFRARTRVDLEALAIMEPDLAPVLARFDAPDGFEAFARCAGQALLLALGERRPMKPGLNLFSARAAGVVILYYMMLGAEPGDGFPPSRPIRASINHLAKRFAVSRTHVLRLLREAEREGFLRRAPEAGENFVVLTAPERIEHHFAATLLALGVTARRAAQEMEEEAARTAPGP